MVCSQKILSVNLLSLSLKLHLNMKKKLNLKDFISMNRRLTLGEKEKKRVFASINQIFEIQIYYRLANATNAH